MSALSRCSLVTTAATLPALAVPAVAIAATTAPELLVLGEQLKVAWPQAAAWERKYRVLNEESFPNGWALRKEHFSLYKKRQAEAGADVAYDKWNDADKEARRIAEAILEIPSADRVGDGIRAAAALVCDWDCEGCGCELLWEMAERAGFDRQSCEVVQS